MGKNSYEVSKFFFGGGGGLCLNGAISVRGIPSTGVYPVICFLIINV